MKLFFVLTLAFGLFQLYECEDVTETYELPEDLKVDSSVMGTAKDRAALRKKIFADYDKINNPDDVDLKFGLAIIKFDVDKAKETFESDVWIRYVWSDNRLAWDSKENNITVIRASPNEVWKPDVTLYNNAEPENFSPCGESNVLIYSTGKVLWVPPCHFSSFCNLTYTQTAQGPEQTCTMKFGSWTYDGNNLKLGLYNNEHKADIRDIWENNKYKLTGNKATWVNKFYPCCEEPYPYIDFDISFRKKTEFCV